MSCISAGLKVVPHYIVVHLLWLIMAYCCRYLYNIYDKLFWPKNIKNYEVHHSVVAKVMKLAKLLGRDGFDDMTPEDKNDLIDVHSPP